MIMLCINTFTAAILYRRVGELASANFGVFGIVISASLQEQMRQFSPYVDLEGLESGGSVDVDRLRRF